MGNANSEEAEGQNERRMDGGPPDMNTLGYKLRNKGAMLGREDIVESTMRSGRIAIDDPDPLNGHTALHETVIGNHFNTMKHVLEDWGGNPNVQDVYGRTALDYACRADQTKFTKELLRRGANPNLQTKQGRSALHTCVRFHNPGIIQLLVEYGGEVNAKDKMGHTPLHVAAAEGHDDCVVELIACGAEVMAADNHKRTPLHSAAQGGHALICQRLAANGADLNAKDIDGKTPAMFAHEYKHDLKQMLLEVIHIKGEAQAQRRAVPRPVRRSEKDDSEALPSGDKRKRDVRSRETSPHAPEKR